MTKSTPQENNFFDRPATIRWILLIFYCTCILLVLADFIVHRHIETTIEKVPAFYALYGFVACVTLVIIAKEMRKLLIRDEHYYENDSQAQNEPLKKGEQE